MAQNGLRMWGGFANACKICQVGFLAKKAHERYCSPDCRREGLGRAKRLNVRSQTIRAQGVDATKDWAARCAGCGRTYGPEQVGAPCPICGAEVRPKRRKT